MTNREIDDIINKIKRLKKEIKNNPALSEEDREDDIYMVDEFIDAMCDYSSATFDDKEKNLKRNKMINDGVSQKDIIATSERIEFARKTAHDNLILRLRMVDAECRRYGIPEIYGKIPDKYKDDSSGLIGEKNRKNPGVVETRHEIADWTWNFIMGCTACMDLGLDTKIDELDFNNNRDYEKISEAYNRVNKTVGAKKILHELIDDEKNI